MRAWIYSWQPLLSSFSSSIYNLAVLTTLNRLRCQLVAFGGLLSWALFLALMSTIISNMAHARKQNARLMPSFEPASKRTLYDFTQEIDGIFQNILARDLESTPTPFSDQRSLPKARPRSNEEIQKITEDARHAIYKRIRPIERIFGRDALEPERKAPEVYLRYWEKSQQFNRNCDFYIDHRDLKGLEETYATFQEWLGEYLDSLLEFEANRVFKSKYKNNWDVYPQSVGTFKVVDAQVIWTSLATQTVPEHPTSKKCLSVLEPKDISAMLETQLESATFHLSISSDSSIRAWRQGRINLYFNTINTVSKQLAKEHGTDVLTDPCSDLQMILDIIGTRCRRIVENFESRALKDADWTIDALYQWIVERSEDFKEFIEAYNDILKEDQSCECIEWNKTAKKVISQPEDKQISNHFPTAGQYWRTKFIKSLNEEEPAQLMKRPWGQKLKAIYMAQEDFEDFKLPRHMEAINTGIQMENIDGSPARQKNGTKVLKYLIDIKDKFRGKLSKKRKHDEDEDDNNNTVRPKNLQSEQSHG